MNTENNERSSLPSGIRIAIAIGTLVSVLVAFNQCTVEKNSKPGKLKSTLKTTESTIPETVTTDAGDIENESELPDGLVMPPMNSPADEEFSEMDVGVKSFEQIYLSMASVTGVSPAETNVQRLYKEIVVQLPIDNNLKNFVSSHQVAITKLSAEFCERLVENQTLRSTIWPNINMGQSPNQVLNTTNRQVIINQAIDNFLPPLDSQSRVVTFNELGKLFDELLAGEDLGNSVTTRKVVKGMCIATLSSAHSTLL